MAGPFCANPGQNSIIAEAVSRYQLPGFASSSRSQPALAIGLAGDMTRFAARTNDNFRLRVMQFDQGARQHADSLVFRYGVWFNQDEGTLEADHSSNLPLAMSKWMRPAIPPSIGNTAEPAVQTGSNRCPAFSLATIRSIPWVCQRFTALWSAPIAVATRRQG